MAYGLAPPRSPQNNYGPSRGSDYTAGSYTPSWPTECWLWVKSVPINCFFAFPRYFSEHKPLKNPLSLSTNLSLSLTLSMALSKTLGRTWM